MPAKVMTTPSTLTVVAAIGQDAANVPAAVVGFDLAPQRRDGLASTLRASARRSSSLEPVREIGERPADIGGNDVEKRLRGRREEADVQTRVQKQRRDVGAVQDVLEIVGRGALPLDGLLKLAVERGELLVERLQLLLRGLELLVGRLEFLVDGHGFFVDRLLLLVGDLEVADGAAELLARGFELLLQLQRCARRRLPIRPVRLGLGSRLASSMKLTSRQPRLRCSTGRTAMLTATGLPSRSAGAPVTATRA